MLCCIFAHTAFLLCGQTSTSDHLLSTQQLIKQSYKPRNITKFEIGEVGTRDNLLLLPELIFRPTQKEMRIVIVALPITLY